MIKSLYLFKVKHYDIIELLNTLNKNDKVVEVFINGYRWGIERGKEVEVPRQVKRILEEAKYI